MKDIPGFGNYLATEDGCIFRRGSVNPLKPVYCKHGYQHVSLSHGPKITRHSVHRLVMLAFRGKSALQVDHINAIRDDNRLDNLRYVTAKENTRAAWAMGLRNPYGHVAGLDRRQANAVSIYMHRLAGIPTGEVAKLHGVSAPTVCDIFHGRSWPMVSSWISERLEQARATP